MQKAKASPGNRYSRQIEPSADHWTKAFVKTLADYGRWLWILRLDRVKLGTEKSLQRGNMTEDATSQGLPTTMGFAAKQAIDALRRRNVATAPVLREAGISERDLAASSPLDHRISAVGQSRLLDRAAEAIEDTAFGLHLAEQADARNAGIIFYAHVRSGKPRRSPGASGPLFPDRQRGCRA